MSMTILQLSSNIRELLTGLVSDEILGRAFDLLSNLSGNQRAVEKEAVFDELRLLVQSIEEDASRNKVLDLLNQMDHQPVPVRPDDQQVREIVRYFPDNLQDLAYLVGIGTALEIARRFGGTRLYIPNRVVQNELADLIGEEALQILSESLGGQTISIPRGTSWHARIRWMEIQRLTGLGFSEKRLALLFGVTERWIRYVRSKTFETSPTNQMELPF